MSSYNWFALAAALTLSTGFLSGCQQSAKSFTKSDCQRLSPIFDIAEQECKEHVDSEDEAACTRYTNYARLAYVLGCSFAPEDAPVNVTTLDELRGND